MRDRDSYREEFIRTLRSERDALREEIKLVIEQRNHEQRCVEQKQRLLVQGAKHTKWHAERAERFRKERDSTLASSNRSEYALNQIQEIAEECVSNPGCELNTVDLVKKMAEILKGCKIS